MPKARFTTDPERKYIPTVVGSEVKMQEDVPAALRVLAKNDALDLVDILGLNTQRGAN